MANPRGQQRDKPFRDALRMETIALENGEVIKHPRGSLRDLAQAMLFSGSDGDIGAIKETGDRLDGKVPQAVVGDDNENPINVIHRIERTIVDPTNPDSSGIQTAAGTKPV